MHEADSEIQERGLWNVQPPDTGLEFSLVVALTADRVSGLQEFSPETNYFSSSSTAPYLERFSPGPWHRHRSITSFASHRRSAKHFFGFNETHTRLE